MDEPKLEPEIVPEEAREDTVSARLAAVTKHAEAARLKLLREAEVAAHFIRAGLPEPTMVHMFKPRPWVSYDTGSSFRRYTVEEGLAILRRIVNADDSDDERLGMLEDVTARSSGCLSICPDGEHGHYEVSDLRWEAKRAVEYVEEIGKGYESAELHAFVTMPWEEPFSKFRVGVKVRSLYSVFQTIQRDPWGHVVDRTWNIRDLDPAPAQVVKWASGGEESSRCSRFYQGLPEGLKLKSKS